MSTSESDLIHEKVQAQFGATAAAYTASTGHGDASALNKLVQMAGAGATDRVLDIATGAGHTALAFAPHVREVVAYDLTAAMLRETEQNAAARGLTNVKTQQGPAETLPFPDATFDIVAVRLASHHFADNAQAVREMARVTRPGGRLVVVDNYGPEDDALDAELRRIETLRDASHVRSYKLSVWRATLQDAGLHVTREVTERYSDTERGMNFDDWVKRAKTSENRVNELRRIFTKPSNALRELLKIEDVDGTFWFTLPQVTLIATK
jgi:ubiquinone/menaquinone biosynthesis C-methylase UbiE